MLFKCLRLAPNTMAKTVGGGVGLVGGYQSVGDKFGVIDNFKLNI